MPRKTGRQCAECGKLMPVKRWHLICSACYARSGAKEARDKFMGPRILALIARREAGLELFADRPAPKVRNY